MAAIPSPEGIDKLIHERARLGIMSSLAAAGTLTFNELKETLSMTDGNLSGTRASSKRPGISASPRHSSAASRRRK